MIDVGNAYHLCVAGVNIIAFLVIVPNSSSIIIGPCESRTLYPFLFYVLGRWLIFFKVKAKLRKNAESYTYYMARWLPRSQQLKNAENYVFIEEFFFHFSFYFYEKSSNFLGLILVIFDVSMPVWCRTSFIKEQPVWFDQNGV